MKKDGKQLEGLASFVDKTLLTQGLDVKTNERVYNDEGIQIAEGWMPGSSLEKLALAREKRHEG